MNTWTIVTKLYPGSSLFPVKDEKGKPFKFTSKEAAQLECSRLTAGVSGRSPGGGPYYFVIPS
jgi:hypothetical protein